MLREWLFEPLDTLFFRDGFSLDAGEPGYLESVFPPYPQTLHGALRSNVLLAHCLDIGSFGKGKCNSQCEKCGTCRLQQAIGNPKEGTYGTLDIYGSYLVKNDTRYFPTPLDLMREKHEPQRFFSLIIPDSVVPCDLGDVHLPAKPKKGNYGVSDSAGGWISEEALEKYITSGEVPVVKKDANDNYPSASQWLPNTEFCAKEYKVGIARDYQTHNTKMGNLYSIVPLRFLKGVKIGLLVEGLDTSLEPPTESITKLGGEGRLCTLKIQNPQSCLLMSSKSNELKIKPGEKLKILLLQPADLGTSWSLLGKVTKEGTEVSCWQGQIKGIEGVTFRLISACIGKQQRIGGWDMALGKVKPMRRYVPAGSVYFLEVMECDVEKINKQGKLGKNTEIGLGSYIIGRWNDEASC